MKFLLFMAIMFFAVVAPVGIETGGPPLVLAVFVFFLLFLSLNKRGTKKHH